MTMMDWLRAYNLADVIPFIEALEKTWKQYYPNEIDMLKDAVSIPGISMTYVLHKVLKMKGLDLYTLGQPCIHTCGNYLGLCTECKQLKSNCTQCVKNMPYKLLDWHDWRPKYNLLSVYRDWKVLNMKWC